MTNNSFNSIRKNLTQGNNDHVTKSIKKRNFGDALTKIVLIGAGIVVLASGAFAGTLYLSSPSQKIHTANYFKNEKIPQARDYSKTGGLKSFNMVGSSLKVHMVTTETGFDAIDSELHEECAKKINSSVASDAEKKGFAYFRTQEASKFLTCTAKVQRSRFCDSFYRSRFADRIKQFLVEREASIKQNKRARNSTMGQMFTKTQNKINEVEKHSNGNKRKKPRYETALPTAGMTRELGDQIGELSELGLLSLSDFRSFFTGLPEGIEPYVKEAKQDVCG